MTKATSFARAGLHALLGLTLSALLAACGGGGGGATGDSPGNSGAEGHTGGSNPAPPVAATPPATVASAVATGTPGQPLVSLTSDAGDFVGQGRSYAYDNSNAVVQLRLRGAHLDVEVRSREIWAGSIQLPAPLSALQPGRYTGLPRTSFQDAQLGGMDWSGEGRGCNVINATVEVLSVSYQAGVLQSLDLGFEQHCEGQAPALRGRIRIGAEAMASVMAPQNGLAAQPVVSLVSQGGDPIGGGAVYAYDHANADISVTASGAQLSVRVNGDQNWMGEFLVPGNAARLAPGTYTGLTRHPFQPAGAGALSWWGHGGGCNTLTGAMTINSVQYDGAGQLAAIDLDFEQHCEAAAPALKGHIAWTAHAALAQPMPLATAPAGLWTPPAGAMPATGNAMYVVSDWGDYIGDGYIFRVGGAVPSGDAQPAPPAAPDNVAGWVNVSLSESDGLLKVGLTGAVDWDLQFKAMDGLSHLQPGYYGIVKRYPFHNPRRGGMNLSMNHRSCNTLSGWFMVDSVRYEGDRLAAVDLRFAQYCENGVSALRGQVRWALGTSTR